MSTDLLNQEISLKQFIEEVVGMSYEDYENGIKNLDMALQGESVNVENNLE